MFKIDLALFPMKLQKELADSFKQVRSNRWQLSFLPTWHSTWCHQKMQMQTLFAANKLRTCSWFSHEQRCNGRAVGLPPLLLPHVKIRSCCMLKQLKMGFNREINTIKSHISWYDDVFKSMWDQMVKKTPKKTTDFGWRREIAISIWTEGGKMERIHSGCEALVLFCHKFILLCYCVAITSLLFPEMIALRSSFIQQEILWMVFSHTNT